MTCFENLSNEIYYEIFDYLNGCEIYKAFLNLNIRFQQLITSSSLPLKISLNIDDSQPNMEDGCRDVIIPNKHRIMSLHLGHSVLVQEFFTRCRINSLFTRLESIILYGMIPAKLISNLHYFKTLPRLLAMTISLDDYHLVDFRQIYPLILDLPFLRYNSLSMNGDDKFNAVEHRVINERFSSIESLIMHHGCSFNGLISILSHTPRLKYLSCRSLFELLDDTMENEVLLTLPHLTHVSIENCEAKFDVFENFIKKISSHLKMFRIGEFSDENYNDPDRWKQLILKYMPQLCRINVRCSITVDNYFKDHYVDTFVHQFTSRFWFERGWNITLEITPQEIFYVIHSNR
jgi:hypothetical protein